MNGFFHGYHGGIARGRSRTTVTATTKIQYSQPVLR